MKHCFNPLIRAHLSRCLYLILLIAVCVIPFALGQRATTKQSAVADPRLLGSGPLRHCLPATILRAVPGLSRAA